MTEQQDIVQERIREARDKGLRELDLSGVPFETGNLSDIPSEVFDLEHLEVLNLSWNEISTLPESIARLQNLNTLNLFNNQLSTLPESIARLQNLNTLNLSDNRLSTLPEVITRLHNLTHLNLTGNQLSTLPEAITRLKNLNTLNLFNNQLSTLPESIARLQNLNSLNLAWNQLTALPSAITRLQNLNSLDLSHNQLTALPSAIAHLQNLNSLDLSYNQLSTLPEDITHLQNLISLDLAYNGLQAIPNAVFGLFSLKVLVLENFDSQLKSKSNQIKEIPRKILQLEHLESLSVYEDMVEVPPPEVVYRGPESIRDYFRQIESEGEDYIYEAKLLIVGEPGAGKTSLSKKIEDPTYVLQPDEDTTRGIDIITWEFDLPDYVAGYDRVAGQDRRFRVNIWDFGGQEIYHSTHQYFLTRRSVYALVADTRKEDTDFYYWLNVVELLSVNSPMLIVKNEKQNRHREINERQLRSRFANLKETLATNLSDNRGLDKVVSELKHYLCSLPHIGTALPRTWVDIRAHLDRDQRDYISLDEYLELCEQNGFRERSRKLQLSGYLHDLGVILHFQEDPVLNNILILKPQWGTEAAYKVLDNERVIRNQGRFDLNDLAQIWDAPEYEGRHNELLQLMINFNLCYEIPGGKGTYIAPQLLGDNQPESDWDERDNLILRYTSPSFMPKGIATRFIVAMHRDIEDQTNVWKSGVVLNRNDTRAEVIEDYGKREVRIRVSGQHKKELMNIVTYRLDEIYDSFGGLEYNLLIPCNCSQCLGSQEPHFYAFENLKRRIVNGQFQVQCEKSFEHVDVRRLIDDVVDSREFSLERGLRISDSEIDSIRESGLNISNVERFYYQQSGSADYMARQQNHVIEANRAKQLPSADNVPNAWINGSFVLFSAIVVLAFVAVLINFMDWYVLPLVISAGAPIFLLVNILLLKYDDRIPDKTFITLTKLVVKQLPGLKKLFKDAAANQ